MQLIIFVKKNTIYFKSFMAFFLICNQWKIIRLWAYSSEFESYLQDKVSLVGYENSPKSGDKGANRSLRSKVNKKINFSENLHSKIEIIKAVDLKP